MPLNRRALLTLVFCLAPVTASAQSITTTPVAPVPVGSPWLIVALGLMLLGGAWWMLGRRALAGTGVRAVALAVVVALGAAYVLNAQAVVTFTDPSGETLSIPINPELSVDDVMGWEPADFTNTSGVDLLITAIDTPTFAECVPGGLDGVLMAGSSDPSPHPLCEVNETLASGATCRVDVETICRAAAVGNLATLTSVAPASGTGGGGTAVTLTGTNLTGATSVTFDGSPATAVTVVNATTVTATTQAHAPGPVDVVIATPAGIATLDDGFTYTVSLTGITATSGSAAGGVGVTLTGVGLTAATSVTFDGIAATSVNVVSSTTVTAVTPAHAAGAVDVAITTPLGSATLASGFTYVTTAVGQPAFGGIIAALNGGLNNLIAAVADNSTAVGWGGFGTAIGAGAQNTTDGASNTAAIVTALGANGGTPYAAQVCSDYEVDSQGNTPCQAENACYFDWFLPAGGDVSPSGQLYALYTNQTAIGGFSGFYWSSTEFGGVPTTSSWSHLFTNASQGTSSKLNSYRVRCVRAFTP